MPSFTLTGNMWNGNTKKIHEPTGLGVVDLIHLVLDKHSNNPSGNLREGGDFLTC